MCIILVFCTVRKSNQYEFARNICRDFNAHFFVFTTMEPSSSKVYWGDYLSDQTATSLMKDIKGNTNWLSR
jgi:hypothetical protein